MEGVGNIYQTSTPDGYPNSAALSGGIASTVPTRTPIDASSPNMVVLFSLSSQTQMKEPETHNS